MTDSTPITALGGPAARVASFGSVSLTENTGLALASLAGAADVAPMGLDLPPVGGAVSAGGYGAFWTGPSQWMIEAAGRAETDFAAALQAQAPDCVVTEQTDGFVCFEITAPGAGLTGLLQKLVNLGYLCCSNYPAAWRLNLSQQTLPVALTKNAGRQLDARHAEI